jgi:hypothetical protein
VARLQRFYVSGDVAAFRAESARLSSPVEGLTDRLFNALVDERNKIFLPRLLPLLSKGSALIAVGAGHLYGEQGLLRSIEQQGYKVEPLDRNTLAAALFAQANRNTAGIVEELLAWMQAQGLELPAGSSTPALSFVPTRELEKAACAGGRACAVSLFPQGDKILASVEIYHRLRQRDPAILVNLLSLLVNQAHGAQLAANQDNRCASWRQKFVENVVLQGKYLASRGLPAAGIDPPEFPQNCQSKSIKRSI